MQFTSPRSHSMPPAASLARLACIVVLLTVGTLNAAVATFEDVTLATESYWNGADESGGFTSGSASFNNLCKDPNSGYWEGFACSNCTDTNDTEYTIAQYNAIAGSGQGGTSNYAVAFVGWEITPTITFDTPQVFTGLYVTNNCYAFYEMRDGGPFTKKFGGDDGNDADWFKLTITGFDANDASTGAVEFYLADFRFENNALDYILDSWAFVDLTPLGQVKSLQFTLSSTDTGDWGMNTPGYVCIDAIVSGIDAGEQTASIPDEPVAGENSCRPM